MYSVHNKENKYIAKDLRPLTKAGINFFPGAPFWNMQNFNNKRKTC